MSDWINRASKQLVVRTSPGDMMRKFGGGPYVGVDGNAVSNSDWIHNPDLTAVSGFSSKHWRITEDVVSLLSQEDRDAVDLLQRSANRDELVNQFGQEILEAFAQVMLDELNLHASAIGLPNRTIAQLKSAIKNKLGA